jgi:hypothetical protein
MNLFGMMARTVFEVNIFLLRVATWPVVSPSKVVSEITSSNVSSAVNLLGFCHGAAALVTLLTSFENRICFTFTFHGGNLQEFALVLYSNVLVRDLRDL